MPHLAGGFAKMIPEHITVFKLCRLKTDYLALLFIALLAATLLLTSLDNQILWQDEAQTATIAKTILQYGIPKGFDGKNFFSQEYGVDYDESYVWKWHTWLSFYVAAASFYLFGTTTFAARFPFALFGLATVILTYYAGLSFFRNRRLAVISCLLLLLTIPFLVLSRQCRYYSLTMFFSVLSLIAYKRILDREKFSETTFIIASTLLFHTHYVYFATLLGALGVHSVLFFRDKIRLLVRPVLLALFINLPWILWFSSMRYQERYSESLFNLEQFYLFGRKYFFEITSFVFPPMLLLLALFVYAIQWWKRKYASTDGVTVSKRLLWLGLACLSFIIASWTLPYTQLFLALGISVGTILTALLVRSEVWKNVSLLILFILVNMIALLLSVPFPYLRYVAPVIPVLILLTALIIERALNFHLLIGVLVIGITILPNRLIGDYFFEITHSYVGPMGGIVQYLQTHGSPHDTVLITYEDLPLKFYTDMKVVGGLTGEDVSAYTNPQWIVLRKYPVGLQESTIRRHAQETLAAVRYEKIALPFPDLRYQNREDPREHIFRPITDGDSVFIYRRME